VPLAHDDSCSEVTHLLSPEVTRVAPFALAPSLSATYRLETPRRSWFWWS